MRFGTSRRAAGALLTIGLSSAAATAAIAAPAPDIRVADTSIRYGQAAVVRGTVGAENAGRQVALEYATPGGEWRVIRTGVAGADGRYGFATRLRRTGVLRVGLVDGVALRVGTSNDASREGSGGGIASGSGGGTASDASPAVAASPAAPRSAARRVTVAARIAAPFRRLDVRAGEEAVVRGRVGPWRAGRLVRLELLEAGRWRRVASDRTDARGRYALSHRARFVGGRYARVTFRGDAANARSVKRVGRLHGYREALASRYDMYGGPLGCGGRLGYNALVVAHKTLPCGTKLRIRYRGRTVTATVRDRGPYVGGREFDLAGAVARRLGFDGVGRILVTR
ncbi:MAG TPA: septal ring lytic transglycosylase RlpA family protein [Solirubrobacteraceae bacterium]|nr:septal ring lytic transglycosylase RlpA family protein [Solirubrobacteraceae bacterium]